MIRKKSFQRNEIFQNIEKIGIMQKHINTAPKEGVIKCFFFEGVLKTPICINWTINYFVKYIHLLLDRH